MTACDQIATDLPCYRCGYNLRRLNIETRCPECGHAIGEVLRIWRDDIDTRTVTALQEAARLLYWTPIVTAGVAAPLIVLGIVLDKPFPALLGLVVVGLLMLIYVVAAISFAGTARALRGETAGAVMFGAATVVVAGGLVIPLAAGTGSTTMVILVTWLVCLPTWTAFHARLTARLAHEPAIARFAQATVIVGVASIGLLCAVLAASAVADLTGAVPGFGVPWSHILPILLPAAVIATLTFNMVLMRRLRRWLERVVPLVQYLRAERATPSQEEADREPG